MATSAKQARNYRKITGKLPENERKIPLAGYLK
jgi:hypothetical protein